MTEPSTTAPLQVLQMLSSSDAGQIQLGLTLLEKDDCDPLAQHFAEGITYHDGILTVAPDLPPLNVATFRESISGGANQGRARDATREEVHCGADHREAP